jgi:DNA polymerase-3 subunit alpha/error-prone DNA polymerase
VLIVHSAYSFLRGASMPAALVRRAAELGFRTLALADEESLAGAADFWELCRLAGIRPILGACAGDRVVLVRDRTGYGNLCRLLTARKLGGVHEDTTGLHVLPRREVREVWFATAREWRVHRLLSAIRENTLVAHVQGLASPEAYLRKEEPTAAERRLADSCAWEFLPAPKVFPGGQGGTERLRALVDRGLAWRYGERPPRERADDELEVIGKLGYADYFLVVHDIVAYSRERGLPVAGRGSGASSVVAYALGITNVCPIDFDLPFERFLHEGRTDYPDIDVDFSWRVRDDVIAEVFRRFGDVAMVSTHITFQARSAFREAAKAYGYSDEQVTLLQRRRVEVPDRARIEAAASAILGLPRHFSVHPGGIVLQPAGVAPMERAEKGVIVTQFDKDSVERVGLVKIDLLGNRALSTIRETTEIVERTSGAKLDVERLPADPATVSLLHEARTLGCNQLESPAMRSLIRMMRPSDAKGLMRALALIRPGAASLGMKEAFVRRERGFDPSSGGLLADTHGIMLYEDDAMIVASALTGLPLSEGDRFRRRVQKLRTDDERRAVSKEFLDAAVRHGTPAELARDLWIQMAKFTEFSFCRAHAASYGVLAWASAWLAAHHPVAHWVAALNNNQGLYDARVYLEQAKREGIRVLLPCVRRSGLEFSEEDGAIRVGFNRVFGIERREVDAILAGRPYDSLEDFLARVKLSAPSLRALVLCGALDGAGMSRPRLLMFARSKGGKVPEIADFAEDRKFAHEMEILGLSARRHILSYLAPGPRAFDSRGIPASAGKRVRLVGIMATARIAETAKSEPMEFVTLEDEFGLFEAVLFPDVFRRCRSAIGTLGPYEVIGKVEERYGAVAVRAEAIRRLGAVTSSPVPAGRSCR